MNYQEFVTDEYVTLKLAHHFGGQLLNRIPLMRRLKWRALVNANILYGTAKTANQDMIPTTDISGDDVENFQQMDKYKPYIEIGYGVENIFKIIRVEVFNRITYFDKPNVNRLGVKIGIHFRL